MVQISAGRRGQWRRPRQDTIPWRLVDVPEMSCLGLCPLQSHLQLRLGHLQVANVSSSPILRESLARLLVRHWKGVLEPAVTVPKLVTSPLFGLDS